MYIDNDFSINELYVCFMLSTAVAAYAFGKTCYLHIFFSDCSFFFGVSYTFWSHELHVWTFCSVEDSYMMHDALAVCSERRVFFVRTRWRVRESTIGITSQDGAKLQQWKKLYENAVANATHRYFLFISLFGTRVVKCWIRERRTLARIINIWALASVCWPCVLACCLYLSAGDHSTE